MGPRLFQRGGVASPCDATGPSCAVRDLPAVQRLVWPQQQQQQQQQPAPPAPRPRLPQRPRQGGSPARAQLITFRKLWRIKWLNRRKEAYWLLALDGHPTAARMQMDAPCPCGTGGAQPGRRHAFWDCPATSDVRAALAHAAGTPTSQLQCRHVWLCQLPPGSTLPADAWQVLCMAAVEAMDTGRKILTAHAIQQRRQQQQRQQQQQQQLTLDQAWQLQLPDVDSESEGDSEAGAPAAPAAAAAIISTARAAAALHLDRRVQEFRALNLSPLAVPATNAAQQHPPRPHAPPTPPVGGR